MNLKRNLCFLAGLAVLSTLFTITGCSTALPYQESRRGNYFYLNPFSKKPATPAEHLAYASQLEEKGKLRRAREEFEVLTKRWPESPEAASAKQSVADLYFQEGKYKKAFETYEELIDQYYNGIKNYDKILEQQVAVAEREMNRKHMRWLFGGYRAPERAIPFFESIIRNAPQWERTPEMQYLIGQAYQENDEFEMAVVAYSTVEYRYPDSPYAEKAAYSKIEALRELVRTTPYSTDIREQAEVSASLFISLYPDSEHLADVQAFSEELRDRAAQHDYEVGEFYERVPRPPKTESAAIYYEKVVEQYGGTEYAAKSAERLRVLFPGGGEFLADGKAPIRPAAVDGSGTGPGGPAEFVEPATLPERLTTDEEAVEVSADKMEYAGKMLIADGNVAIQQKGASLQADHVTVNPDTGEITATGNILMVREGARWEGQELVYNYKTRVGTFGESELSFEPAYITAEKTERISTNEFLMHNVMMTTCSGDNPTVYAKAKEVRVIDNGEPGDPFIKAKNVTFYVGPVPVFYTPVWQRHLGYRVFTFAIGAGGRLGGFIMGRAELHPTDWLRANTHFDLYSKRGLGLGQDFDWVSENGHGGIQTYYINDNDATGDNDLTPAERALIDSQRYRVKIRHQQQIDDETYFMTQLNWLSDPTVIEDFFNDEYRYNVNPENYAVVQRATEHYAIGARIDHRLNDFYTTVDRLPEVNFDWYRGRIGQTPLYFESENSLGFFETLNARTNLFPVVRPSDYNSARFDTYNRMFLPLRIKDFYNVIPRAGYRGTWYSDTPGGSSDYRSIFELGVLNSFKAYKMLTDKSGFYGDGLRHVVEPYVDYSYRYSTIETNTLYQFDEIDVLDNQNELQFGVRNFLQTKRGTKRIANFLDSDVFTTYRFNPLGNDRDFGPLVADAKMHLTDNFFVQGDFEYDWYTHELTPANARMTLKTDDDSEYSLSYRYRDDIIDRRSLVTVDVKLFPNAKWSYEFMTRYDGQRDEWEERKILVNHRFDCVGMGLGYRCDEDDQHMFWVQFWLTAFPKATIDLGK